jgi:hypothetical protein
MKRFQIRRSGGLKRTVTALVAATGLTVTLIGAAPVPTPSPSPSAQSSQACWTEAESSAVVCAADTKALNKLVLSKYNKVIVTSDDEFKKVKSAGTFASLAVPAGALASYTIGILYHDSGYTGQSMTYTTTNSTTCYGGTQVYSFQQLPSYLNDNTSSFIGYGACQVKLFRDINYGGASYGYFDCRSNLANNGFNDVASSVKFSLAAQYNCS